MPKKRKKSKSKSSLPEEALYVGFGLASMAKDQFDAFASFLVKEGKLMAKDQTKFRKQLTQKGEKYYKGMMKDMEKASSSVLKTMNPPTRKEFEALKRKVEGKKKSSKKRK